MEQIHKQRISESKMGYMVTQETRMKISNSLKGNIPWNKDKSQTNIQEENHYKWKGGTRMTARKMAMRRGLDLSYCRICKEKNKRIIIHHIDGNKYNNDPRNWAIICDFCHNAIHDTPNKIKNRFQIGHQLSKESIEKIRKANIGHTPWNKGIKINKEEYPYWGNTHTFEVYN